MKRGVVVIWVESGEDEVKSTKAGPVGDNWNHCQRANHGMVLLNGICERLKRVGVEMVYANTDIRNFAAQNLFSGMVSFPITQWMNIIAG